MSGDAGLSSPSAPAQTLSHAPFSYPAFRLFWFARLSTTFAYQMFGVAVGWQIYDLTRSAYVLGLVGLAQFLPSVVLVLASGHIADRYDRRRVVRICQAIEALVAATLAAATLTGHASIQPIFVFVVVIGAMRAFETPTLQALLPSLVPPAALPRAVALSSSAGQTGIILGPAVGGFLYVAGAPVVYATAASLFLLAHVLLAVMRSERTAPVSRPVSLASLFAGIAFIKGRPVVLGAISLDLFAVLLGGATALLPIYARDILGTGAWGLGLLRSAPAVGALAMAIFLAHRPLERHVGRVMFAAVAVFGLATLVFGVSHWLPLSMLALVVLGAGDMISVVIRTSLVQLDTPDAMRGRVSAVNSVFVGASNQLGEFESGMVAGLLGPVPSVVLGGLGTLLVVALWMRLFPDLTHRDRLREAHPDSEG
ncbi:MFS transporter [Ralstonia solanacearum]|uniref:MFS transporter n=1 Tax=Ralstonia solanacearum TaxID=305 RepID=A0AAD0SDB5_RALSL|nr:MFS transporter [Ralstonia solanacearum]AXV84235.1 MFS transporter [Ralstonia solanacearum]AXW55365.1 MFS transporter [Ralstonia solanacearum]